MALKQDAQLFISVAITTVVGLIINQPRKYGIMKSIASLIGSEVVQQYAHKSVLRFAFSICNIRLQTESKPVNFDFFITPELIVYTTKQLT